MKPVYPMMWRGAVLVPFLALFFSSAAVMANPREEARQAFDAGDLNRALAAFAEGVKAGDAASAYHLGRMTELGLGLDPDMPVALSLYRQAADGGDIDALNRLALMHYRGEAGMSQNFSEAARLFAKAADKGNANALYNLGRLHFEGKGMARDVAKAIDYYRLAADKDHILALNTLGALYREGARSDGDRQTARSFFRRSADLGNAVGLYETARMVLEEGTDPQRMIEAHMYLNLASARLHPNAPRALQELTALMTPQDVIRAQTRAQGFKAGAPAGAEE
uniref:Sel1 repeat family protein n=1 Tax=Agrobacterium albertimagni TaxID=147266 RepID=A0A7C1NX64_9HYPH